MAFWGGLEGLLGVDDIKFAKSKKGKIEHCLQELRNGSMTINECVANIENIYKQHGVDQ